MRRTEKEIILCLQRATDQYAPLVIRSLEEQVALSQGYRVDAIVKFSVQDGPTFEALVEVASVATPKNVLEKSRQLGEYISQDDKLNRIPMIVAPYIGTKQAKILEDRGISWIDLSGNMSVKVSNQVYIERTGKPNRFPDTAPIKKIFQGTSALVSRALLLTPEGFTSLEKIVDFINQRSANITLSTVSKVLKKLEDEFLIDRNKSLITVADPEKLLERLAEGYRNSTERKRRNSYRYTIEDLSVWNLPATGTVGEVLLAYGFYAAQMKGLAATEMKTVFVRDIEQFRRKTNNSLVKLIPDAEFGNYIITETNDPGVWFNADYGTCDSVVDDIELYLEMTVDTPRGPKIAEQLKKRILQKADADGRKDN
ncbi:MAG: hypothetical protein A2Z25_03205 [Planctomycetes bacterium RBG_16_55_9]|nr:MAG: hypothetical protein A2Z25_03205 [Planctomycetes bacterium RBG_16_55_9]